MIRPGIHLPGPRLPPRSIPPPKYQPPGQPPIGHVSSGENQELRLTLPLPPTANHLYLRRRGGQVSLTDDARRFREQVKRIVVDNLGKVLSFPTGHECVYKVTLHAFFESLENPGWFEIWNENKYWTKDSKDGKHRVGELKHARGERKAETRYKVLDVDNRIKFLQDSVTKAVGIPNDCQVFETSLVKLEDPDNARAEVLIEVVERNPYFPKRRTNG